MTLLFLRSCQFEETVSGCEHVSTIYTLTQLTVEVGKNNLPGNTNRKSYVLVDDRCGRLFAEHVSTIRALITDRAAYDQAIFFNRPSSEVQSPRKSLCLWRNWFAPRAAYSSISRGLILVEYMTTGTVSSFLF